MITQKSLKDKGYKRKRYFRKVWSWRKFKFITIETDTDKLVMEKNGESYCFEYPNYLTHKDKEGNIKYVEGR